jgi:NAD(P)-dependent dehydrogenase (short-subunit alcohol dehydrogenase family)
MNSLLQGKHILVTGAARGIELAVAEAVVAAGGKVAMADVGGAEVDAKANQIGGISVRMDVSDEASVVSGVNEIAKRVGTLDGLVNNAVMLDGSHAGSVTESRFEKVLSANLTSILRVSQAVPPYLPKHDASIVNTLSTQALFGQANAVACATARGGALNLTRAMAIDLAPVRVNAVAPGFIDTRMAIMADGTHEHATDWFRDVYIKRRKLPLGRAGTPQDCAGAFLFLLSSLSNYISGQCIAIDGGLTATY